MDAVHSVHYDVQQKIQSIPNEGNESRALIATCNEKNPVRQDTEGNRRRRFSVDCDVRQKNPVRQDTEGNRRRRFCVDCDVQQKISPPSRKKASNRGPRSIAMCNKKSSPAARRDRGELDGVVCTIVFIVNACNYSRPSW
jgi:hypothetical protein